jgi:ornithine cyclodeaminase
VSASVPQCSPSRSTRRSVYPALIEQLQQAFAGATVPLRHAHKVNSTERSPVTQPAWRRAALCVKIVTAFQQWRGGGRATYVCSMVDRASAGAHRWQSTDAQDRVVALASTSSSGRPDAVVVGTGKLAPYMASAHAAARKFERVLVWGRSPEKARSLANRLSGQGLNASAIADLRQALAQADVVTCATTAATPVLQGADVRAGTHVDLVGGFTPTMREADDALVAKASVFVDTYVGALAEGGDVVEPLRSGVLRRSDVRAELAELCRGEKEGRRTAAEITLFKSVGTALEDLAAAQMVHGALQR